MAGGQAAWTRGSIDCAIVLPWAILIATAGALGMGVGVMEAFSAAYGFGETAQCRGLEQAQLACVSGVEALCGYLRDRNGATR
jgi:hypothetical protein